MRFRVSRFSFGLPRILFVSLLLLCARANPAQGPAATPEAFRLRVMNMADGPVELSVDAGKSWMLVARVVKSAAAPCAERTDDVSAVIRVSGRGIAFGIGGGRMLKLLADDPAARRDPGAITLNVTPAASVFRDFMPPAGTPVLLAAGRAAQGAPLPADYVPRSEDILVFAVSRSDISPEKLAEYARSTADNYQQRALARIRAAGQRPVSGELRVTAALKAGDTPSAVTFLLDGSVHAIMNTPPFTMKWDTREWTDGEHLIEIRAMDSKGVVISRVRRLVVVSNTAT